MADVVLLDGRTVDTWSQDWLVECREREIEARKVLDLPTKDHRRYYLAGVGRDRGAMAQARLEVAVRGLWERRVSARPE